MLSLLAFGIPGPMEIIIICGVLILLFGATKIPTFMRNMGSGINQFKKGLKEGDDEAREEEKKKKVEQVEKKEEKSTSEETDSK